MGHLFDEALQINSFLAASYNIHPASEQTTEITNTVNLFPEVEANANKNSLDLDTLIKLVEEAPTAQNYRLLSAAYRGRKEEEQAEEYEALALSLELPDRQPAITSEDNPSHQSVNILPVEPIASSQRQEASTFNLMASFASANNEAIGNKIPFSRIPYYQPSDFRTVSTPLLFRGVSRQPFVSKPQDTLPQPRELSLSIDDDIIESDKEDNSNSARKSLSAQ